MSKHRVFTECFRFSQFLAARVTCNVPSITLNKGKEIFHLISQPKRMIVVNHKIVLELFGKWNFRAFLLTAKLSDDVKYHIGLRYVNFNF